LSWVMPVVGLFGLLLAVELTLAFMYGILKPRFQWLITPEDEVPEFPPELIEKYAKTSFDPNLGWARQANTTGVDTTPAGAVHFSINAEGCRTNPGFDGMDSRVVAFGDSFTFCRLVGDGLTWPHKLSRLLNTNVRNFGVGNYGFDQALLRMEAELPQLSAEVVIIGVVPETIARVQSYWKHYFEYGNTLAFKPRFTLEKDDLVLHPTAVQQPEDFASIHLRLDQVRELDHFYDLKFRRDMIRRPYLWHLLANWRRQGSILGHLTWGLITGNMDSGWRRAFNVVIASNARWTAALFREPAARNLLAALIERYASVCHQAGRKPILLVTPQPIDFADIDAERADFSAFFKEMGKYLPVLDMSEQFRTHEDRASLYVDGVLGPHVSARGNDVIAEALAPVIQAMAPVSR
jgi:hypothetical protein